MTRPNNFALIGVAGFVAPKHLKAIRDTGGQLLAATDVHDSVGVLDSYFPSASFFTEIERFDRFLEKQRRRAGEHPVDFVSVCTPNYLHDAHVRLALRTGAHAICEKPLVINPWNLDQLTELEEETGKRVYTVLQLRLHEGIRALKAQIDADPSCVHDVCLTYVTRRGKWYHHSWKGAEEKSGGVAMNIGIHFFDLLIWLFGPAVRAQVHQGTPAKMSGYLELKRARVRWLLSIDEHDLPADVRAKGGFAYRSLTLDGREIDLSERFTDLHTEVYKDIQSGGGFGIADARPAIDLVYQIRNTRPAPSDDFAHPLTRSLIAV